MNTRKEYKFYILTMCAKPLMISRGRDSVPDDFVYNARKLTYCTRPMVVSKFILLDPYVVDRDLKH